MPTVLRIGRYRFHFYADEGNERPHVHVDCGDEECKFWLVPIVELARNRRIAVHDLSEIRRLVIEHQELLITKYNEFRRNRRN